MRRNSSHRPRRMCLGKLMGLIMSAVVARRARAVPAAPLSPPAEETQTISFTWDVTAGATSYVLQIGTASGGPWTVHDHDVGNVLAHDVDLESGIYYSRVVPYTGATPGTPKDEQVWMI